MDTYERMLEETLIRAPPMNKTLSLNTVAAVCAISTVACFVGGAILMGSSGVEQLIPDTGEPGRDWVRAVEKASGLLYGGAWLIVLMGFLAMVAFVGFFDLLRGAGTVMVLAPILGTVGLVLVTISHLIPIAMAYELAPAYTDADQAGDIALDASSTPWPPRRW